MYTNHFGFSEKPFSIAPDPHFLYMSPRHKEALAHLVYGINSEGGFVILTGEVGTGKTTLCRCLIEQLPESVDTAFIMNPTLTAPELLAAICDEFRISYGKDAGLKELNDRINAFLVASSRRDRKAVLIIDEAQNLSVAVLEQLRLLTNLETNKEKLLQIILLGQEELIGLLKREDLRQLEQRVTARFHLTALSRDESSQYISHRLQTVGGDPALFSEPGKRLIHKRTRGIPRLINVVCDRALLGAFASGGRQMTRGILRQALAEVLDDPRKTRSGWFQALAVAATLAGFASLLWIFVPPQATPAPLAAKQPATADRLPPRDPGKSASGRANSATSGTSLSVTAPAPTMNRDADTTQFDNVDVSPAEPMPLVATISESSASAFDARRPVALKGFADPAHAFVPLFALWGTAYDPQQAEPCAKAISVGLRCMTATADVDTLRRLNRPAVLQLADNPGEVLLTRLSAQMAAITDRNGERVITVETLANLWPGQFILLWRMPPAYQAPSRLGDTNATVAWLQYQLDRQHGLPARLNKTALFDSADESRVRDLQEKQGLTVDGVVGAETWMVVNGFEALGIPVLAPGTP